eukprot:1301653-Rhodomonas_salina.2
MSRPDAFLFSFPLPRSPSSSLSLPLPSLASTSSSARLLLLLFLLAPLRRSGRFSSWTGAPLASSAASTTRFLTLPRTAVAYAATPIFLRGTPYARRGPGWGMDGCGTALGMDVVLLWEWMWYLSLIHI